MEINELNIKHNYLFCDIGDKKQPIRQLSAGEVEILIYANKVLFEFQYFNRRMLEIEFNYTDCQDTISKYSKEIRENDNIDKNLINEIFVNVNRTFINFITSLKVFVEHIEERFKKKKGEKNSEQFRAFKKDTHSIYNTFFSYRLFINLRDYAIHYKYPIDSFKIDRRFKEASNASETELIIEFSKIKLLSNEKIKRKLLEDLKQYNNLFPINFSMIEIQQPLKKLFDSFIKIENKYFVEQANIIVAFVKENKHGTITSYGKMSKVDTTGFNLETVILPINIVEELREKTILTINN